MAVRSVEKAPRLDEPDERLQWARERAGFANATDAARRYGWNENTYRSHENGQRGLSKKAAAEYARAFKVPVQWLIFGEGSMTPPLDPERLLGKSQQSAKIRASTIYYTKSGPGTGRFRAKPGHSPEPKPATVG